MTFWAHGFACRLASFAFDPQLPADFGYLYFCAFFGLVNMLNCSIVSVLHSVVPTICLSCGNVQRVMTVRPTDQESLHVYMLPINWIIALVWLKLDFKSPCKHLSNPTKIKVLKVGLTHQTMRLKVDLLLHVHNQSAWNKTRCSADALKLHAESWPGSWTACKR